jgi:HlyD family secretion protein
MRVANKAARLIGALAVMGLMGPALAGCGKPAAPTKAPTRTDARVVRVTRVESRPLQGGLTASGLLVSREEAAVSSDLTGYRVARVYVEQGAWVKRGQPLVQLDDSLLKAQIAQAAAQYAQAASEAKRVSGLDNAGVLSQEQLETRRYQAEASKAALDELREREAHMTIRAPVAGLVLERNVRPGDIASAGGATPMFRMVRDGLVELNAEVAEEDMGHIRIGDPVRVSLPDGAEVTGHVRLIDPLIDQQTKLGHVRVLLPVRSDLRPGGFARGTFVGTEVARAAVPETAVRYDADGASVMTVDANNRVHSVEVKTGRRASGYVELLQGPADGARVLLSAASFVLDGDPVRPIDADASAPAAPAAPSGQTR